MRFDNAELAQALGLSALVLILAEGGLTTSWRHARAAAPAALLLATVGVTVTILIVAEVSHLLLSLDWRDSLPARRGIGADGRGGGLLGMRKLRLPPRLAEMSRQSRGSTTRLRCWR